MGSTSVSIIMPTYNNRRYIGQAIQSVLEQSYANWELLIVDDGSVDDTGKVVAGIDDPRISYIYQTNKGVSAARNVGIAAAQGEYIAFLDADDLYQPEKLAIQVAHLDQNAAVGLNYVSRIEIDQDGNPVNLARLPDTASLETIVLSFPFAPTDCMVRRSWLEKSGGFSPAFVINEDRDWYIRLALAGCRCEGINQFLSFRRLNSGKVFGDLPARMDDMLRALETAFLDARCPAAVLALRSEALCNIYLIWAYQATLQNEIRLAHTYWAKALSYNPSHLSHGGQSLLRFLIHAAVRDGGDHEMRLRRVFAQLPGDMVWLAEQCDWAVARGCLVRGVREIMWGRLEQGQLCFARATELGAQIDESLQQVLTHQLLNFEKAYGTDAAQAVARTLLPALEPVAGRKTIRRLRGQLAVNQAFRAYRDRQHKEVIPHALRALFYEPPYLANRGVVAILTRSILAAVGVKLLSSSKSGSLSLHQESFG
jgi:glycosyltransferase involved in cell wall biosynthesis